jgi:plastocyanin
MTSFARGRMAAVLLATTAAFGGFVASSGAQTSGAGTIRGHIKLTGPLPGNPVIRMGMDPMCARINAGKRIIQEYVAASADGSLANVFVHLEGSFPKTPVPKTPAVLDQRACVYVPRVIGAVVGQTLEVRNDDNLLHNVHSLTGKSNAFNVSEPVAGMVQRFVLKDEEVMLKIKCDVHSWMTSYVGIVSNPYFAVSNGEGTFEIPNVPAGAYTIAIWQEQYGPLTRPVRVRAGATTTVDFTYTGSEKPAKP